MGGDAPAVGDAPAAVSDAPAVSDAAQRRAQRIRVQTLLPPAMSRSFDGLQYSAHFANAALARELRTIFPDAPRAGKLTVIVTMQRCETELMLFGDAQALEKDRQLERFFEWARATREQIGGAQAGAWVEAADPASGYAAWGRGVGVYAEADGANRLLGYGTDVVGGCTVVRHPQWGTSVYLASMFTSARADVVQRALLAVNGANIAHV